MTKEVIICYLLCHNLEMWKFLVILVDINLRLARYQSWYLFRKFLLAKFLDWELCSQKSLLNVSAISLSSEITFSPSNKISGSLKAFPFFTSKNFICKFTFVKKKRFYFSPKVLLAVTSSILRLM